MTETKKRLGHAQAQAARLGQSTVKQLGRKLIIGAFALFGGFVLCCGLLLCLDSAPTFEAVLLMVFGLMFIATSKLMPQLFSEAYQLTMKFVRWLKN